MSAHDLDPILDGLRAAVERAGTNLVAIEQDPHCQLLAAASLRGVTADRWRQARVALASVFEGHRDLTLLVDRAGELRRVVGREPRAEEELRFILTGPSVVLHCGDVGIDERGLLDPSSRVERCTPGELIARMTRDFETARMCVADVGHAWDELVPRLATARQQAEGASQHAHREVEAWPELGAIQHDLAIVADALLVDPLSVDPSSVGLLETRIHAIEADVNDALRLRSHTEEQISAARCSFDELDAAARDCRGTIDAAAARVATIRGGDAEREVADLGTSLDHIADSCRRGQWRAAAAALSTWHDEVDRARHEIAEVVAEARAAVVKRDELRGRLDAYSAKAAALGLVEDPTVCARFDAAHRALFTGPSDLTEADALVQRYQESIATVREREVQR